MAREAEQARQQMQAAGHVVREAVSLKNSGAIPPLVRQLRKAVNKLKKQHYGTLPGDGESFWRRLNQEFEIAGDLTPAKGRQFDEALGDFLNYLKTLFDDGKVYDERETRAAGEPGTDAGEREQGHDRADHMGRVEDRQEPDAGGYLGIGNSPSFNRPDETLSDRRFADE